MEETAGHAAREGEIASADARALEETVGALRLVFEGQYEFADPDPEGGGCRFRWLGPWVAAGGPGELLAMVRTDAARRARAAADAAGDAF